jgi:hypothetical protein
LEALAEYPVTPSFVPARGTFACAPQTARDPSALVGMTERKLQSATISLRLS